MGTTLTGTTPQDTYDSLIKVTDNGPLSGTLKALSDGLGNDSTLSLSTTAASIAGTLAVSGTSTFNSGQNVLYASFDNDAALFQRVGAYGAVVRLGRSGVSQTATIDYPADGTFAVSTAGVERLRATAAGLVGIGTSAPVSKLQVLDGDITVTTLNSFSSFNSSRNIIPSSAGTQIGRLNFSAYSTGTTYVNGAAIESFTTDAWSASSAPTYLAIKTVAASSTSLVERVRIDSDGLKFNGDTAAANALDDYEEGTWTMGISFGGASAGVTYNANTGTYTKIGRQVTVNGYLILSSKGSSSGAANITGLPFTIANSQSNLSTASLWLNSVTFLNQHQAVGKVNSTSVEFWEITTLGAATFLDDANFANNSEVIINFTYFV
jgi:hypothetical protein